jgi:hypothetical protein
VRVDSVKLFEISSFTAIVERAHSRFPLLPPFVEIPYIGTFAGVPIGPAREFHSSSAILSAYARAHTSLVLIGTLKWFASPIHSASKMCLSPSSHL